MRSNPSSWTNLWTRLGFTRKRRKSGRRLERGRLSRVEPLEERRLLAFSSLQLGPHQYQLQVANEAIAEVAPDDFRAGHFTLTSDDWTGKDNGSRTKQDDKSFGIDSGLAENDPTAFDPNESWSFRLDGAGMLMGIEFDGFSVDDADRARLTVGDKTFDIAAKSVVNGYWRPPELLEFDPGEVIRLDALEATPDDLEAAEVARREKREEPGQSNPEPDGPPQSVWRVKGLNVVGRDDQTFGGYIDLTRQVKTERSAPVEPTGTMPLDGVALPIGVFQALTLPTGENFEITSFTVKQGDVSTLEVRYSLLSSSVDEPFEINIHRSTNGTSPVGDPLMSYEVDDEALWQSGTHTIDFAIDFDDDAAFGDYYLVAAVDGIDDDSPSDNQKTFAGGVFVNSDGTVHFHGANSSAADSIDVQLTGATFEILWNDVVQYSTQNPAEFSAVHVRTHGGNDTVDIVDSALDIELWAFGGSGNDNIYGGAGDDRLEGGDGIDTIYGNGGNDLLSDSYGGYGSYYFGGDGDDDIRTDTGPDLIHGGDGDDLIYGGDEAGGSGGYYSGYGDLIYGDAGDDVLFGEFGNDTLYGGDGNDLLYGDSGDDQLYGDADNDVLIDAYGTNTLNWGQSGHDPLVVNTPADENETLGDENFRLSDLSLREAVAVAAAQGGVDTIEFDTAAVGPTITLSGGQLTIDSDIDIVGPGTDQLAIDGDLLSRVFYVSSGATVELSGLAITNGKETPQGGAIRVADIYTELTLDGVAITGSHSNSGGGAIFFGNYHVVNIRNSLIAGNSADSYGGAVLAHGGELNITNSTFSDNSSIGPWWGGALMLFGSTQATVINSTITDNHAIHNVAEGGGYALWDTASIELHNSIVAGNTAGVSGYADGWQALDASSSYNLLGEINNGSYSLTGLGNVEDVTDPGLAPLGDYGGPTWTHPLLADSAAIDGGSTIVASGAGLLVDQRGLNRFVNGTTGGYGGTVDIGAYEFGPDVEVDFTPPPPPPPGGGTGSPLEIDDSVGVDQIVLTTVFDGTDHIVHVNGFSIGVKADEVSVITVNGLEGDDLIDLSQVTAAVFTALTGGVTINGGDGDDMLIGSSLADTISGGDGSDILFGEGGDDILNGNSGNDVLDGGTGVSDSFDSGPGDDIVTDPDTSDPEDANTSENQRPVLEFVHSAVEGHITDATLIKRNEGQLFVAQVRAFDPEGDEIIYTVEQDPNDLIQLTTNLLTILEEDLRDFGEFRWETYVDDFAYEDLVEQEVLSPGDEVEFNFTISVDDGMAGGGGGMGASVTVGSESEVDLRFRVAPYLTPPSIELFGYEADQWDVDNIQNGPNWAESGIGDVWENVVVISPPSQIIFVHMHQNDEEPDREPPTIRAAIESNDPNATITVTEGPGEIEIGDYGPIYSYSPEFHEETNKVVIRATDEQGNWSEMTLYVLPRTYQFSGQSIIPEPGFSYTEGERKITKYWNASDWEDSLSYGESIDAFGYLKATGDTQSEGYAHLWYQIEVVSPPEGADEWEFDPESNYLKYSPRPDFIGTAEIDYRAYGPTIAHSRSETDHEIDEIDTDYRYGNVGTVTIHVRGTTYDYEISEGPINDPPPNCTTCSNGDARAQSDANSGNKRISTSIGPAGLGTYRTSSVPPVIDIDFEYYNGGIGDEHNSNGSGDPGSANYEVFFDREFADDGETPYTADDEDDKVVDGSVDFDSVANHESGTFFVPLDGVDRPSGYYQVRLDLPTAIGNASWDKHYQYDQQTQTASVIKQRPWVALIQEDDFGFGPGWNLAGIERIIARPDNPAADTIYWIRDDGYVLEFDVFGADPDTLDITASGDVNSTMITYDDRGTQEDAADDLFVLTDKFGTVATFDRDGWIIERADRYDNTTTFEYYQTDKNNDGVLRDIEEVRHSLGNHTSTFAYDNGHVETITDFAGRETTLAYTGNRLHKIILPDPETGLGPDPGAGILPGPTTVINYNGDEISSLVDADGNSTHFSYSADGDILTTTYSDPSITGLENDPHTMQTFPEVAPHGRLYARAGSGTRPSFATAKVISADERFEREGRFTDELGRVSTYEVNDAGYVSKMTDPTGRVTTYGRNSAGQVTEYKLRSAEGTLLDQTSYTYDAQRNLTDVTYFDGTSEHWTFDTVENHSRLLTYTDPLGRETIYTYTEFAGGAEETMTVRQVVGLDDTGSSETDDLVTTYEYDTRGLLIETREKRVDYDGMSMADIVTMFTYADTASCGCGGAFAPRIETITYAAGTALQATVAWEFDTNGNPTSFTDEVGRKTLLKYDALDRLVETIAPDPDGVGTGVYRPVMQYVYTDTGRVAEMIETSVDNPAAATPQYGPAIKTVYEYDFRNRLKRVIENYDNGTYDPQDVENDIYTDFFYDAAGQLTRILDPLERETHFYYDLLGRPTRVTEPDPDSGGPLAAPVSYLVYDATGRVRAERDARGSVTNYVYDNSHRLTATRTVLADSQQLIANSFSYDDAGQLTSVTDPEGRTTTYTYDAAGRLIELIPPLANSQQLTANSYSYDTLSNLRIVTDQLGHETKYVYDARYRLVEEIDANGDSTEYTYFDDGQLETLTDAVGNTTTWTYDPLGRVASETNELNDSRTYEYDEFHRLVQMTDRNERVTTYDYDGLHRLIEERWLDGMSTVNTITYDYDQTSQLTDVSDAFADYHYDYDDLGRATTIIADLTGLTPNVTLTQDFDAGGLRTQLAASIGATDDFVNDYTYDQLGRMTRIEQHGVGGGNSVSEKRVDFNYNLASQFETISRYADLAGTEFVADSAFEYDGRGRLVGLVHSQNTTTFADYGYEYDQADRLTDFTNGQYSAENVTYSYDDRGQLLGADYASYTDETYTYDDNGNRNNGGFTPGTNNRLTTDGTYTYAYDDEGNRTARFIDDNSNSLLDAGDDDITEYVWDHRNRLIEVTERATFGGSTTKEVDFVYDAFDRLIKRTVDADGAGGGAAETEFLINDGRRAVLILEPDGDVIRRSLWADAVDMLLADEDALGETYFHLADHLGTTRDVVDDQGNLVNHLVFDSFGNILSETSSSADHTRIYAGLIWEVTIDQYRSFTRFYDPATGIWTSEDPIGFAGGDPNLGRYVGNGPTGYVDPSGLIGVYPIGGNSGVQEAMDVITVYENTEHLPWWQRLYVVGGIVPANWTGVRGVSDACSRHDAIDAHRQSGLERGIDGMTGGISLVGTAVGGARIAVPRPGLGGATGPLYRTWNQFQAGTTGQFATRAEAAAAWRVYKPANGIVTGVSRSESASRQFLRSLADDCGTAKWMRPWLQAGRRPPGYEIDHIVPLSIGGKNVPANMRLQGIDLHRLHHRYYHPWTR